MRALFLFLGLVCSAIAQGPFVAANGKFPALNVQATVGTKQRAKDGSFYQKSMSVSPKMTIEGVSRLSAIPAAEATFVIVTMNTRAKYAENKEAYHVHGRKTLPIPAATTGDKREFEFKDYSLTFDSYRDNSNIGGEVYKYFVFGLRDPETKELIDFRTNYPSLAAFCKAHPEKRDEFLGMAKGKAFPASLK